MHLQQRRHPGQSMVVIALFGLVLFVFVGLGLDSGMLYLERRQLQNAVDAACLAASTELALGGSSASAIAKGQEYHAQNLNASAQVAFDLVYPVVGSTVLPATTGQGTNLQNGIEVSGQDVRVAATAPAFTYFMRLAGISTYTVTARAHCGATAGGGLLPIAVVRFPAYDIRGDRIYGADTTAPLPQQYGNGKKPKYMQIRDALRAQPQGILNDRTTPTTSYPHTSCVSTGNWYHWADNGGLGNPSANPRTGPYYNPELMGCAASSSAPGYPLELAGNGASASVGSSSFRGPIALDVRQIGVPGGPVYYNDWDKLTSTNAKKQRTEDYIKSQYPGPPVEIADQVGLLSGVNAGNIIAAIQDRYPVGSKVITVVYDGHVFRKGDFELSITCSTVNNPGCNPTGPNGDRYVERPAPPSNYVSKNNATNKCEYSAEYYIADGGEAGFSGAVSGGHVVGTFRPAKYVVQLAPIQGSNANTVKLVARLSGANIGSASHAGGPEDWGHFKVRWSWTDVAGLHSTGYLYPDDPAASPSVALPASGTLDVTLEVIQTAFGPAGSPVSCGGGVTPAPIPDRKSGAYTIQVTATESVSGRQHVAYGLLGMNANATGSNKFEAGDYFLAFLEEPVAKAVNNDPQTLLLPLQLTRADDPSNSPNDDDYTQADLVGSTASFVWYRDGVRITPAGTAPANLQASLVAPSSTGGNGNKEPFVQIDLQAGGVVTGTYDLDVQFNGVAPVKTHSTRFRLIVESDTNPSIDEWIVALCYSEFQLLGAGGDVTKPYKQNELWGRATSGCKDKDSLKRSLTSRLVPW